MPTGTVKWFNAKKGYGFISPDDGDKDLFVHITEVQNSGLPGLTEGQRISFDVMDEAKGLKAVGLSAVES